MRLSKLFGDLTLWRSRKARYPSLDQLCASLQAQVKRGGRGSDLAAAELKGVRAAMLAVRR